MEDPLRMTGN